MSSVEYPLLPRGRDGRHRAAGPGLAGGDRLARYGQAWAQALGTARRLTTEFGAARVVVVGALLHPERFGPGQSITLVAWGLRAEIFWQAVAGLRAGAVPAEILDGDRLDPATAALVIGEGVELAVHRDA